MDTEYVRAIAELLALKDAPDDVLLDQVGAIGVNDPPHAVRRSVRLQHADQATARTAPPWLIASTR